ncbi:glycosyl transferase family 2 [Rhodobacter aestuarii]|uniref:Glycosyl transferase family 2 n=1 Tax=Rhodobacter aestuarii TaxID=453582 RepID=A0A1N7IY25_9RHOB|nr:glycosyltransferase [Rhodobacter aestuarii]PTV97404.1 glycosyl transferase family 2 [Rhodobacter aestuarii]SIS41995.1 Glycosyl transferase family 2 [Rhodobacter aestuarii]
MKTLIAVPAFNRLDRLRDTMSTVFELDGLTHADVVIFNDGSTDYSHSDLTQEFAPQAQIVSSPTNSGRADFAVHAIFNHFAQSGYQRLFLCDSDLIVSSSALTFVDAHFSQTEGILSLLNASAHPAYASTDATDMVVKHSIGFAGTVWSQEVVAEVLRHVPQSTCYDWDICTYMRGRRKIYCAAKSQVQHFGTHGQNSTGSSFDFGEGFTPTGQAAISRSLANLERLVFELKAQTQQHTAETTALRKQLRRRAKLQALGLALGATAITAVALWGTL